VRVVLNGAETEIDTGATVTDIVERLGRGGPRRAGLAVARNGEVVARGEWDSTRLQPDDRVEVLGAVQGG
jgi:sulfur carrier protein